MTQWTKDIIPLAQAGTLDATFRERVRRTPEAIAYKGYDKAEGAWRDTSWQTMAELVTVFQQALAQEQLQPGERVAIVMRNCREWVVFDQAALALGLVVVPLYTDDRPENIAYILNDCAARLLLVQDAASWKKLGSAVAPLPDLQCILIAGARGKTELEKPRARYVEDWLEAAASAASARGTAAAAVPATPANRDPHALASIVYTSGTTGRPKGVMLSHHNMLAIASAVLTSIDVFREDIFISLLPLSHTLERTANYYMPMLSGSMVAYSRAIPQLGEDLMNVRPTVMICVPRVLERFYARIDSQMQKQSRLAQAMFRLTVNTGWRRFENSQGRGRLAPQNLLGPTLQRRVAAKFLDKLGGRLRLAISGGAALPLSVAKLFIGLGLPVLQGYGLTETSPVISVNTPEDNDPASVGVALPGVEVSIGDNDELLARGPGIMLGYWNNAAATAERISDNGWLRTGDQARIERGHIYITGRIKDILVMSNGEKVPPADMEMAITLDPLFEQALVVGEGRAFLAALLVLNPDLWTKLAADLGLDPKQEACRQDSRVHSQIVARVTKQLSSFPGYAKVRRVILLSEPWSVENSLLTPTLKVKRNKVMEYYQDAIHGLFEEARNSPAKSKS